MNELRSDWKRVKQLFEACMDSSPAERERLLGNDTTIPPEVRAEVEALLAAHGDAQPLDGGAAAFGAVMFDLDAADDREETPAHIGPYRLLRELGRGGMGVVWLAERDEPGFSQRVALKRIRSAYDSPELRARFRRERAILARLAHDRIARLYDGGVDAEGRPWFALEFVQGEPLTRWCDARKLSARARAKVFLDVLEAVAYAHRNLVVHRDLKPANVLVDESGRVKLLDFGIAKLLEDDEDASHTATGARLMTASYAAPEQVRGEPVSTATDVYTLGVMLYELMLGVLPYRADAQSRAALLQAIVHEEPERASRALARAGTDSAALAEARATTPAGLRAEMDRDLEQIFAIALAKAPEQRHASVDALTADLRAWLERRPLLSRPTPHLRRIAQFVRRHRVGVAASVALLLTAVAGVGATLWQARVATRHAETERAVREFTTSLFAAVDPDQARGRDVPLREVLDTGARRAESGLRDQPAVRGALLSDLGAIYTSLGDSKRGRELLSKARDAFAIGVDRNDDELARVWLRLSAAQFQDSQFDEAARSADAALALLSDKPVSDPMRVEGELRRGRIDEELDHLDAANARLDALVAALRLDPATTPASLSDALSTLGNLRRLQTRFEEAQALQTEALDITRGADPSDPIIAQRLHELAGAEQQTGHIQEGIAHLREAFALHQKNEGALHPLTLSTEGELAQALGNTAAFDEAEALFKQNIDHRRNVFGAQHEQVAHPLNNYGINLFLQKRFVEAAQAFGAAWEIWRKTLGEEHASTRQVLTNYAGALTEAGDYAQAEPLLKQAYDYSLKLDPPRGQGSVTNTYGILLEKTGRLEEAEAVLRKGLAVQFQAYSGDEIHYIWPRVLLGRVLRERGDIAGAREQLEKALIANDKDDYPDGPKTATCLYLLALVRQAQHEPPTQLRPLLERALAVQEPKLGKDHADTVATREFLARLPP